MTSSGLFRRVSARAGWILVALPVVLLGWFVVGFAMMAVAIISIEPGYWFAPDSAALMTLSLLAGIIANSLTPLILLFATTRFRGLSTGVFWVLIAEASTRLLSSVAPFFKLDPVGFSSFTWYNFRAAGGWRLALATAVGGLASLGAIWLYTRIRRTERLTAPTGVAPTDAEASCLTSASADAQAVDLPGRQWRAADAQMR